MADATGDNAPLIIKKVKKAHHEGHHGGSWKVAYADFVTAMMAFFLLLWLISVTSDDQRRGIAEYFSPTPGTVDQTTGGSGFFRGNTVATEGPMVNTNAAVTVTVPLPSATTEDEANEGDIDATKPDENAAEQDRADSEKAADKEADAEQAAKLLAEIEEKQFKEAEFLLRQAIQDTPDLKDLAENLIIDNTPEGLRIQIVDQDRLAMFPRGSSEMHEKARLLMHKVAEIVKKMPQKIVVTGHTDSTPYANAGKRYDNWDLSTDRANASRRAMVEAGLSPERIVHLSGKADTEHLDKDNPTSPRNRRISIVLLREQPLHAAAKTGSDADAAPASKADDIRPPG